MPEVEQFLTLLRSKDSNLYEIYKSMSLGFEWVWQFRNRDYGWGPKPHDESSLETTYWVVKNLLPLTAKKYFLGTREFVLNLKGTDGFWGDSSSAKHTFRHTSCAIEILQEMADKVESQDERSMVESAKTWLIEGADPDGGWGLSPGDPHDIHNTFIVCPTLLNNGVKQDDPVMAKTLEWLEKTQLENGGWPLHLDRPGEVDIENTVKSYLLIKSFKPHAEDILKKISSFIIKNQNDDGGWGCRPGLESDISPSAYAFKCLISEGFTNQTHPEQMKRITRFFLDKQDRIGFWTRKSFQMGSVGLSGFILNSMFTQIQSEILTVPLSSIFQLQLPSLTGRTIVSRRIKSPVRELAQVIWQLEGDEHYDIFLDSPETESILFTNSRHFVPLEVRKDIFQRTLEINEMFNLLQKAGDWSRSDQELGIYSDLNDKLNRLGKGLFFDFVPASLQKILSNIKTRYLMIATNDPLIPWELIYLPEKETYLGLEFALGRKVLMVADRLPMIKKSFDNVLHVLLIGNPSGNLPSSEEEVKFIAERLESFPEVKTKVLVGDKVTRSELEKTLSEHHFDIIHYAGHSFYNEENPNKSYLELANGDAIYASQFSWLFQSGIPSVIFLNACSTARESHSSDYHEGQMSGMIRQLMNIGVQSVIGSLWSMHDIISATIATEFYKNLMHGMTLGEALQSSRMIVHNSFKQRNVGWNGFILYGNPMLRLD